MKRIFLFALVSSIFIPGISIAQSVGINGTGSAPNASAMLDVSSTSSGLLVPRMIENQRNAIASPATGLLIYQTNDTTGFYYFNGTKWQWIGSGTGWALTGNSGTTPGTNFIGTTDANDFVFKTNGSENMRLANSSGNLVLGSGDGTGTITGNTLRAPNGSGTNITGATITITPGDGTGTGGSGNLIFQTAPTGSTGSAANTMTERMRITASGYVGVGTSSPVSTLDDAGSIGTGTINIAPAASSTTALSNTYSTVIATPPSPASSIYTLTLPSATAYPRRIYTIVYNGSSLGTIDITSPVAGSIYSTGAAVSPFTLTSGAVVLQSDGTNWDVIGQTFNATNGNQIVGIKTFQTAGAIASQTFDAGTTSVVVKVVGGGGAGGGITSTSSLPGAANIDWEGAGGGAGGYCEGFITGLTAASTFSGTVGTGGTGGVPTLSGTTANVVCTPNASGNGGASTLTIAATTFTANGGGVGPTNEMSPPSGVRPYVL